MRWFKIIFLITLSLIIFSCKPRLINGKKLSMIYADMFIADQWIGVNRMQAKTDTLAVYAPIFQKYGYDVNDFRYSVKYYLNDIPSFIKITENAKSLLEDRLKLVEKEIRHQEQVDSILRYREYIKLTADSLWSFIYMTNKDLRFIQAKKIVPNMNLDILFTNLDSLKQVKGQLYSLEQKPLEQGVGIFKSQVIGNIR